MKLFKRFYSLLHSRFAQFIDRAESPEEKYKNFINEMNGRLEGLRDAVAAAMVEEKKMQKELEKLHASALNWDQRAMLALNEGKESLARDAVIERQKIERLGGELHTAWKIQQSAVEGLKAKFEAVRARTTSARAEFQVSLAKYKAAEAQHSLDGGSSLSTAQNPMYLLEEINEKILKLEAESEANKLLDSKGSESVEAAFRELEQNRSIDDELNRLKSTLALPQPGGNLLE